MRRWRTELGQGGFTLLEVMVAMAILAMALTVIGESQQAGMRHVLRAKKMSIATLLAREKMVEVEDELFEEGFDEFDETQEGKFEDKGVEGYGYKLKVEKIELPAALDPDAMSNAITGGDEAAGESQAGGMAAMGGQILSSQFELFRNVLEQSIRRVSLEVSWKEGRADKSITVTAYFTDPRRVDTAMAPAAAIPGIGSGSGLGSSGASGTQAGSGTAGSGQSVSGSVGAMQ